MISTSLVNEYDQKISTENVLIKEDLSKRLNSNSIRIHTNQNNFILIYLIYIFNFDEKING